MKTMKCYKVTLGSGTRTVRATSKEHAIEVATGRPISRFTRVAPDEYKETACKPGHQGIYKVTINNLV